MKIVFKLMLGAAFCASLGGCALAKVASGDAPNLYVLTAARSQPGEDLRQTSAQILVDEFSAAAVVDTSRIVFQPSENEVKYYKDARWSDSAPKMIQDLLVETLQNTNRFAAVAKAGSELRGDFMLMGDIKSFASIADESGTHVRVAFLVQLVRAYDRSIVSSKLFEASVEPMGSGMTPVVKAYDSALRQVLDEISLWSLDAAASAKPMTANPPNARTTGALIVPNATVIVPTAATNNDDVDYDENGKPF